MTPRIVGLCEDAKRRQPASGRRLPPLDSLRAFEAAARHLSFTRAAAELQVTQAAVSHRVRELELQLDTRLFRRLTRRVELTESGLILALAVRQAFERIAHGMAALDPALDDGQPLRVSILPSFAQRWLVPRLRHFRARHPAIDVRVIADDRLADLHAGSADVAIRFGRGAYPGCDATFLMGDAVLPVCSPGYLRGLQQADRLDAVLRGSLLHDSGCTDHASGESWPSWLAAVGRPELHREAGARFSSAALTLSAAAAGLGIALGRRSLVEGDLAAGRLVPAWPQAAPTTFSYWLVCLPERLGASRLAAFRGWLLDEVRSFTASQAA